MSIHRNQTTHLGHKISATRPFSALPAVRYASTIIILAFAIILLPYQAHAKGGDACTGGGFSITKAGVALSGTITTTIAESDLSAPFHVQGKYVEFDVNPADFAVLNYTLTGAANPLDITGGLHTVIFARKTPDLRGAALTGNASVQLGAGNLVLQRSGPGVSMTIQANDCAQGGIFQMEPERADGTATTITHVLAHGVFYFDNPNFRNPPPLPLCTNGNFNSGCYPVKVTPRINASCRSPCPIRKCFRVERGQRRQDGRSPRWRCSRGRAAGGPLHTAVHGERQRPRPLSHPRLPVPGSAEQPSSSATVNSQVHSFNVHSFTHGRSPDRPRFFPAISNHGPEHCEGACVRDLLRCFLGRHCSSREIAFRAHFVLPSHSILIKSLHGRGDGLRCLCLPFA